ncbi:photosystem II repair protein Psb32 [Prochlorococcus sp. MIT 1300]|uniref:photosystem II repair protein Psb32 n=1 Tax=Prochlorococcus sp. MIT 1300 TaxID=3096218 RepID=UPI002A7608DC|nr:TPM domain-containing protein [Prochlorococcus sp. MIT 1300]
MRIQSLSKLTTTALALLISLVVFILPSYALSPNDFPSDRPDKQVYDSANVLSRSTKGEIEKRLLDLGGDRLDARLITLRSLDYGTTLSGFGEGLIKNWTSGSLLENKPLLLILIDAQTNQTAVLSDEQLKKQLPDSLLRSTARTTISTPLKEGQRYRKASVDGINRLEIVLNGGEDPGPPKEAQALPSNVPTRNQTENSNAIIWVVGLLVIGTIVPMATWWFFSR